MNSARLKWVLMVILIVAATFGWVVFKRFQDRIDLGRREKGSGSVPVEVAPIQRGSITLQRTFSGALEAAARFVVAPKVSGRVERLGVDLADTVRRGQIVAELDNAEYVQAVVQAEAELEVAKANLVEARSALVIATREFRRIKKLSETGEAADRFAFRTPPLRNVAVTGPWMHDGAYTTLEAAVYHHLNPEQALRNYDVSQLRPVLQKTVLSDPETLEMMMQGLDPLVAEPVTLTGEEFGQLMAFLYALTSPSVEELIYAIPESVPSGLPVSDFYATYDPHPALAAVSAPTMVTRAVGQANTKSAPMLLSNIP